MKDSWNTHPPIHTPYGEYVEVRWSQEITDITYMFVDKILYICGFNSLREAFPTIGLDQRLKTQYSKEN